MGDLPRENWKKVFFLGGLIVMGDLSRWKMQRFFKEVKNTEIF
jgi:hypothetical protein